MADKSSTTEHSTELNKQYSENSQDPLQKRLNFLKTQLQKMVLELPQNQQKFSNELLHALAESLLDNTIFGIISHLMDIQHYAEKQLYNKRLELLREHYGKIRQVYLSSLSEEEQRLNVDEMHKSFIKTLSEFDKMVVQTLDEKKRDQQGVLVMAEVPGFEITDDHTKVRVQIRLIDFILRLSMKKEE